MNGDSKDDGKTGLFFEVYKGWYDCGVDSILAETRLGGKELEISLVSGRRLVKGPQRRTAGDGEGDLCVWSLWVAATRGYFLWTLTAVVQRSRWVLPVQDVRNEEVAKIDNFDWLRVRVKPKSRIRGYEPEAFTGKRWSAYERGLKRRRVEFCHANV